MRRCGGTPGSPTAAIATIASGSQNQSRRQHGPRGRRRERAADRQQRRLAASRLAATDRMGSACAAWQHENPTKPLFPADGSARLAAHEPREERTMSEMRVVATGLCFPEGRWPCADGSVVLVEIERQTRQPRAAGRHGAGDRAHRRRPERPGRRTGRRVLRLQQRRLRLAAGGEPVPPGRWPSSDYVSGRIERVDPTTGAVSVLYDRCGAQQAERAERHRVRRARRLLLHRSRQDPGARPRPRR